MPIPVRLVIIALATAASIAVIGLSWEFTTYGARGSDASARLEQYVRGTIDARSEIVRSLATRAAAERALIDDALSSRDRLAALFVRLADLSSAVSQGSASVTVYQPDPSADRFRVLAWSGGPTEALSPDRLAGPEALFIARGTAGMYLVLVTPVGPPENRVAVAAAETVLSAVTAAGASTLDTPYGPATLIPAYAGAGEETLPASTFLIAGPTGAPLLEVRFSPDTIAEHRRAFRARFVLLALVPVALLALPLAGSWLERRRRARRATVWMGWSAASAALILTVGCALAAAARSAALPAAAIQAIVTASVLVAVAILPGGAWWRRARRRDVSRSRARFALEYLGGGVALATVLLALTRVVSGQTAGHLPGGWRTALFPFESIALLQLASGVLLTLALCWGAAAVIATVVGRWRLWPVRGATVVAAALLLAPALALVYWPGPLDDVPRVPGLLIAACLLAFAFVTPRVRWLYRHTTQSARLLLSLLAIIAPLVATYPLAAAKSDAARRDVIEFEYASTIPRHPAELRAELTSAQQSVDRLWSRDEFLRTSLAAPRSIACAPSSPMDSQMAFVVWSQTSLARRRAISDVEIYGPDRTLLSRFALNLPEYLDRACTQTWTGTSCSWDVFGEAISFGAQDRLMLHAERGLCDETGRVLGAVVLHVAHVDYESLPFIQPAESYFDVGGGTSGALAASRPDDLQFAVYGWSYQPLFTSGHVAWPISASIFDRLYDPGAPFWTTIDADDGKHAVYFSQDRQGIYALGYPIPTLFEHAARITELAALAAVLFIGLQLAALGYALVVRRSGAPLATLVREVRTSFYRKLFLFFVLVAIVPVLFFALAFGAYMARTFRADVEFEAKSVVNVARRVFEELTAAEQRPISAQLSPTDDVMVWIRQVINQDVNLYRGPQLLATSQRHLFDSGLAPTRTPARVYQAIALDRVPAFVGEERVGDTPYLIAAAPVTSSTSDLILSVPLAPRQRDIERQIDQLYRGVLVGAVFVVLFAAGFGASMASRISDPVARLTRATRQIAAGRLDVRVATDTADELRRLVDDFNSMASTLLAQRGELARTNQLKAWNEMARQVAHEIKNPLTPIQLAAEHLQRVHDDGQRPLGQIVDQCVTMILGQVRLLRQIASEFANFSSEHVARPVAASLAEIIEAIIAPYRLGLATVVEFDVDVPRTLPDIRADRTLLARALTNLVENAIQAMPDGGRLTLLARTDAGGVVLTISDTGVGMDPATVERAFEPYFSTKTGGSGLGLANAKRNLEVGGATVSLASAVGKGTTVTIRLPVAEAGTRGASSSA